MIETNSFTIARLNKKFKIYSNKKIDCYKLESDNQKRFLINGIDVNINGKLEKILIVGVHLPSKIIGEREQNIKAAQLLSYISQTVENLKEKIKTEKVIFVGDFNLDPYESPLYDGTGLKTTNCPYSPAKISNYGVEQILYYNPSHHLLGNLDKNAYGTYFHQYNWSAIDQVIISKELYSFFLSSKFEVLLLENNKLLKNNRPNKSLSDHLPIKFEFNI